MKALDPKVKKALDLVLYFLPICALIALGGRNWQKVEHNIQSIDNQAVTIQKHSECMNANRNVITQVTVRNEERYDKLIRLMEQQNLTMTEVRADLADMKEDIADLKIDVAILKKDVSSLKD